MNLRPASELPFSQIADLLTRSFEGYFVPININETALLIMMRRDSIDLAISNVILKDGEPTGIALVARRGWTSRLAAMGLIKNARNSGAGSWAMERLIEAARVRGDKEIVLEVIEQNTAGVKLYQKAGFKIIRRLVGYKLENPQPAQGGVLAAGEGAPSSFKNELQEIDIRELSRLVTYHGLKDLPWQLSGVTIAHHTPPSRAFRLNDAYCLISNPEAEHVSISSVLVKARSRGAGLSAVLMRAVLARFPNKIWHVPSIYPEEICAVFDELGMQREEISQWQMSLTL